MSNLRLRPGKGAFFPEQWVKAMFVFFLSFSVFGTIPGEAAERPSSIPGVEIVCETALDCLRILRLENESLELRARAIVTLGALKENRAVPDLISILQDHEWGKKVYHYEDTPQSLLTITAIRALGTIGDRRGLPALVDFVNKEPYVQYRVLAAENIRMIGVDQQDIPALLPLLNDPHTSVRHVIFEAIRFADDPVSRSYTRRFINFVPRADMIEDTITPEPASRSLGVPVYPGSQYVYCASASERWIMHEQPATLKEVSWVHTFLTEDPIETVVDYYKNKLSLRPRSRKEIEKNYRYIGLSETDMPFIGEARGFIVERTNQFYFPAPVVLVSVYADSILDGTAVTIFAPR